MATVWQIPKRISRQVMSRYTLADVQEKAEDRTTAQMVIYTHEVEYLCNQAHNRSVGYLRPKFDRGD